MQTVNKQVANNQFKRLCDALGKHIAQSYNDVGAWRLDYARCYGGYVIEEIVNEGGAVTHPFGTPRMSGSHFYDFVNFSLRAIQLDRENGKFSAKYWPDDKINNDELKEKVLLTEIA